MEDEVTDMTFFAMMADGNRESMGKLIGAKGFCKKLKLPSIDFPNCEILSIPMKNKGGYYEPETNTIKIFVQSEAYPADYAFYHEFGHWVDRIENNHGLCGRFSEREDFPILEDDKEVSEYAKTSRIEAFAETFAIWMSDPDKLREQCPERYVYIKNLFETFTCEVYEN